MLSNYPYSGPENHHRRFQASWFKSFSWLEYSPSKDAAYCFPCYLFTNRPTDQSGGNAFIIEGFRKWKRVNNGKDCTFLTHIGKDPHSPHNKAMSCFEDLKNRSQHIDKVIQKQTSQEIANNRLRLKVSIDVIRWLTFQTCAFRGRNEGSD